MRRLADVLLVLLFMGATFGLSTLAQSAFAAVGEAELLKRLLDPQTGTITVLIVVVVVLFKVATNLYREKVDAEERHRKDQSVYADLMQEVREWMIQDQDRRHKVELTMQATIVEATALLERMARRLDL